MTEVIKSPSPSPLYKRSFTVYKKSLDVPKILLPTLICDKVIINLRLSLSFLDLNSKKKIQETLIRRDDHGDTKKDYQFRKFAKSISTDGSEGKLTKNIQVF